jgi:predicted esterase
MGKTLFYGEDCMLYNVEKKFLVVVASAISLAFAILADTLTYDSPAPGRDTGRIYYYIPDGIDLSKPAPLLIFLHGGSRTTPDTAPENYFSKEQKLLMPDFTNAPFIVAAPSAPPAPDGSRWNRDGVSKFIDATILAARKKFKIDADRVFLGGHSMGCYGAYHLGQILADRFAGVWMSAGAWWESDFRAFFGTPVFIQHGSLDCSPHRDYWCGHSAPRRHHWCGVSFARAANELLLRDGVEHVYDEHNGGHALSFSGAKESIRRFFAWTADKKRNPYAKKAALVTPCGTKHPDVENVTKTRWLELTELEEGEIDVDAIVLHGPAIAKTDEDLQKQRYSLTKHYWDGARIIAENMGENRFRVKTENVKKFAIYLSPKMGDLSKSFTVEFNDGRTVTAKAKPFSGDNDYNARLDIVCPSACNTAH